MSCRMPDGPGKVRHAGAPPAKRTPWPPAFVRAPEGNGCAERFIRTLKENLLWIRTFDTIEDLRYALLAFRELYNTTWLIERHGFIAPAAFRQKQLQPTALAA